MFIADPAHHQIMANGINDIAYERCISRRKITVYLNENIIQKNIQYCSAYGSNHGIMRFFKIEFKTGKKVIGKGKINAHGNRRYNPDCIIVGLRCKKPDDFRGKRNQKQIDYCDSS